MNDELQRIRAEYDRRGVEKGRYDPITAAQLALRQAQERALVGLLGKAGLLPLGGRSILDVGCGTGRVLAQFEGWGSRRSRMAGIDLMPERAAVARRRLGDTSADMPGADIRAGDAAELPWREGSFDLVLQSMVFSSIVQGDLRRRVASEMFRVLARSGAIVWCDFLVGNPRSRHVRRVSRSDLAGLFPELRVVASRRSTLPPPVARAIAPGSQLLASALEACRFANAQLFAILKRPAE